MERAEAIEVIRKNWPDASFTQLREALETLIPELKESEDEKIRAALLRCCDDWEKGQFGCMAKEDVPAIRAYLEKQKEKKTVISDEAIRDGVAHFGITQYQIDNWLKKHINVVEQKPAEWSEEDEEKLKWICECIRDYPRLAKFREECYEEFAEYADWVESNLRPQPNWKPSKGQMKELLNALIPGKDFDCDVLSELYEQLKQL